MKAGDLAKAALAHVNLGELRINQGRLDEALALLGPARRTLVSYGYRVMTALAEMQLGRATAFTVDIEGGLTMERSAVATYDEIGSHLESLESRARLAEVLVFAGRFAEARLVLAEARELRRGIEETPLNALVDRVELTLAALSGDMPTVTAAIDGFLKQSESFDATYDALVVLALAERAGDTERGEEVRRLMSQLGVVSLPMLPDG
jgi:hypothetical protein